MVEQPTTPASHAPTTLSDDVKARKMRFSWHMAIVVVVVFFAFVGLVAFAGDVLGRSLIGDGLFSIGMAMGLVTMLAAIGATALYALRINRMEAEARRANHQRTQNQTEQAKEKESDMP